MPVEVLEDILSGEELIQQAREGDEGALGALLAATRDQLRRQADGSLPTRMKARVDASDIVQQTCLSVFRQIKAFQGHDTEQFAAWVRQIHERNIQNAIRDQLRTRKRGDGREEIVSPELVADDDDDSPSRMAIRHEDRDHVRAALESLPDDERAVLHKRFLEGKTLVQIHEELGLSKEAVVWRLQKGMKRIQQWLRGPADSTH